MEKNHVEIIEKEIGNVIEVEECIKIWKMTEVIRNDFNKIEEYLMKKGAESVNAPYTRYVDIDWDSQMKKGVLKNFIELFTKKLHFFSGMAVSKELGGEGNLKPSNIKKRKYVEKIHCGLYKNVGKTYREMYNWSMKENLKLDSESFEFYLNDPNEIDSQELKTMVLIPLKE